MNQKERRDKLAELSFNRPSIRIDPVNCFELASGLWMPMYNNNKLHLSNPTARKTIAESFSQEIDEQGITYDIIASVQGAVPFAEGVADIQDKPLIYVRDKPKDHGMHTLIEGVAPEETLEGKSLIVIEDTVSTASTGLARVIHELRKAGARVDYCATIFDYEFTISEQILRGERAFNGKDTLEYPCERMVLLPYNHAISFGNKCGKINSEQLSILEEWHEDPIMWGRIRGLSRGTFKL